MVRSSWGHGGRAPLAAGQEVSLRIDRMAYGGEGVGRLEDGLVVFVERSAPDERVRARVVGARARHAQAELVAIEQPSPARVAPRCPHFLAGCGGCAWQHLSYEAQLAAKQAIVRDSLERLGGLRDPPLRPILGSPSPWYYRNKMEFAFHHEAGVGLHLRGAWDRVFSLETCFLHSPLAVEIAKAAAAFAAERGIERWDPRAHRGFLRDLVVRRSEASGDVMVGVVTAPGPFPDGTALAERLASLDARIVSVVRGVRARPSDGSPIEPAEILRGAATIAEEVRGLRFRIGLETFFQTNTPQAGRLIDLVLELAGAAAEGAPVVDLYCGVGLFSLALAGRAGHVAGIELAPAAIAAARENAAANGVGNASFHVGDVRHALPEALERHGPPAVVVLDPPRAGAGGKVMRRIARAGPARIVYVSCNPTTLARDLLELGPFGYRPTVVQPVDLFPQTYHVETVVGLER